MTASTDYDEYRSTIADALEPGFGFAEICRPGSRTHMLPPRHKWRRIIRPLQVANELRKRMMEKYGAKGLKCNAAFRPVGGAAMSMHKRNSALDLDLLPGDYKLTTDYYAEAVRLWCEVGEHEAMGLGFYAPGDSCGGIRVHVDLGFYSHSRCWQHGAHPGVADQIIIAKRLGLTLPTEPHPVPDEGSDPEDVS